MDRPLPAFKIASREDAIDAFFNFIRTTPGGKPEFEAQNLISIRTGLKSLSPLDRLMAGYTDGRYLSVMDTDIVRTPEDEAQFAQETGRAYELCRTVWDQGGEMWFHCLKGANRSPAFAMAMLTAYAGFARFREIEDSVISGRHCLTKGIAPSGPTLYNVSRMLPDHVGAKAELVAHAYKITH